MSYTNNDNTTNSTNTNTSTNDTSTNNTQPDNNTSTTTNNNTSTTNSNTTDKNTTNSSDTSSTQTSTNKTIESTTSNKPKPTMNVKTFEELYDNFKDDPFYGPLVNAFKTYRDFIRNNPHKKDKEWVNQNYQLYTQVKLLLVNKDFSKVVRYMDMINKILLLDKVAFNPLYLLRYDYIWPGTLASRKEWLTLFTLLTELANPAVRKERLKTIDLNEGLADLSNGLKENIKKYYTLR